MTLDWKPPIWEQMDEPARNAYEREFGHKPPGYRGTGMWQWFQRSHPDEAPCLKCGMLTDRFPGFGGHVGDVDYGTPHVDQRMESGPTAPKKRAICFDAILPYCWPCERADWIAKVERRLRETPDMDPDGRALLEGMVADMKAEAAMEAKAA